MHQNQLSLIFFKIRPIYRGFVLILQNTLLLLIVLNQHFKVLSANSEVLP